ncbi:MAG: GNAT family N-acetyltransferase, partial [Clostridia bacterium]
VFTVKEYRNQGVMSHMLDFAVQHVKENGYDLSWLSGNRHRYRNYGWDLAGRQGRYLVEEKAVRKYYPQDIQADISISMADETCKELLAGKYAGHQCGAVRDARHWHLQLKRDNLVWKTARTATGFAYMVHDAEHPAEIPEIQGDGPETVALLKRHMSDNGLGAIEVFSPWCGFASPVPLLNHISSRCTMESIGQLRIVNGKQLREKLMPAMKSSILLDSPRFPTDKLEDPDLWIQTLKGMLGFVCVDKSLPEDLDTLQRAMPIHWWLSRIDSV